MFVGVIGFEFVVLDNRYPSDVVDRTLAGVVRFLLNLVYVEFATVDFSGLEACSVVS